MSTVPEDRSRPTRRAAGDPPVKLRKSLGQHLLVSPGVLEDIVNAAELTADDLVLEVGPGTGLLTTRLAENAGMVVAVEIDHDMAELARLATKKWASVSVVEGDILRQDISELTHGRPYSVVANLPYNIASPTIRMFLEAENQPNRMVVTVQREVAQEMCAVPGRLGMLGISIQVYSAPRIVRRVAAGSFRPPPKVESAVVRLDVREAPLVPRDLMGPFFRTVRAGFGSPRKQLRNSLSHGLSIAAIDVERWLVDVGVDPTRRPETLSIEEWRSMVEARPDQASSS
jgi:16S rRNA (adenine1518-N6/adenine1519-N6)-dimethyltransferase